MRTGALLIGLALLAFAGPSIAQETDALVERGRNLFWEQGCFGCHMIDKAGTPIGPNLSDVGRRHPVAYLEDWLRDPSMQKPTAHMPKIDLTESEIRALAAYLSSLR